ncbi:MAG: cytochrome c maturation protein CcmE [Magnetococcus sp. YQC-5]
MKRPPNKRLFLLITLIAVGGALAALVFSSFTGALVYFHTPSEVTTKSTELTGKKVRIGGMVQTGSLVKEPGTLKIRFLVTDGTSTLPVRYDGMVPDLFREGQGVVVEGTWQGGQEFAADSILAKHSEDYVPVDMSKQGIEKSQKSLLKSLQ